MQQRIRIIDFENGYLNIVEMRLEKVEIEGGWGPSVSVSVRDFLPQRGSELRMRELLFGRNMRRRQFA